MIKYFVVIAMLITLLAFVKFVVFASPVPNNLEDSNILTERTCHLGRQYDVFTTRNGGIAISYIGKCTSWKEQ